MRWLQDLYSRLVPITINKNSILNCHRSVRIRPTEKHGKCPYLERRTHAYLTIILNNSVAIVNIERNESRVQQYDQLLCRPIFGKMSIKSRGTVKKSNTHFCAFKYIFCAFKKKANTITIYVKRKFLNTNITSLRHCSMDQLQ